MPSVEVKNVYVLTEEDGGTMPSREGVERARSDGGRWRHSALGEDVERAWSDGGRWRRRGSKDRNLLYQKS